MIYPFDILRRWCSGRARVEPPSEQTLCEWLLFVSSVKRLIQTVQGAPAPCPWVAVGGRRTWPVSRQWRLISLVPSSSAEVILKVSKLSVKLAVLDLVYLYTFVNIIDTMFCFLNSVVRNSSACNYVFKQCE